MSIILLWGGVLVAIAGAVLLLRRRTRLGLTLVGAGIAMVVLFVVLILFAIRDLG